MFTRRFFGLVLVLFIALSTFIPSASIASPLASVVYVATTGSDSNNCTSISTPCRTINGALSKVDSGGTINVASGTFVERLTINKNVTIRGNTRVTTIIEGNISGPVISIWNSLNITLERITIRDGRGGISNDRSANLTISDVSITRNSAPGLYNYSGNVDIKNSDITFNTFDNEEITSGGGIKNYEGILSLENVAVSNNFADFAAGIESYTVMGTAAVSLTNVLIANNSSGMGNYSGSTATLVNTTLSGNQGSGLYNSGLALLSNVTLTGNGGTGIFVAGETRTKNTIFANNMTNCYGPLTSLGYNIEDKNVCGLTGQGDQMNVDPKLASLQNNGGSTKTQALLAGSPAIDSGDAQNCPTADQRGSKRPQGRGCDVGAYEAEKANEVVVLLHGWEGAPLVTDKQFSCTKPDKTPNIILYQPGNNPGTQDGDILQMAQWLYNDGKQVWLAHIYTGKDGTSKIVDNAACLKEQLDQLTGSPNPSFKVDLVAHSMGGLVARAYLEGNAYTGNVNRFITLGSPHLGVLPFTIKRLEEVSRAPIDFIQQQGLADMTVGIKNFNEKHPSRNSNVAYYTVGGDLRWYDVRNMALLFWPFIPEGNDGLISLSSATELRDVKQSMKTNEAHISSFGALSYFSPPNNNSYSEAYNFCLFPVLVRNKADGCGTSAVSVMAKTSSPTFTTYTPSYEGNLIAGQVVSSSISIQGGVTYFVSSMKGGTGSFTLRRPNGQVIDSSYAQNHPSEISYQSIAISTDVALQSYYITNTDPGSWQMQLQASGSLNYSMSAALQSDVTLTTVASPDWYVVGDTATITATVTGTATPATVTAIIERPDGITDTLTLTSIGGNKYQTNYSISAGAGVYRLTTTAISSEYQREAVNAFTVAEETVSLTNTYTDTAIRIRSTDPLYEFLNVGVGVTASVSGTYTIIGILKSGTTVIGTAVTQVDLTGTQSVVLQFNGDDIRTARFNGQYILDVKVINNDLSTVLEQKGVYITKSYTANQFGLNKRNFLPLAVKK